MMPLVPFRLLLSACKQGTFTKTSLWKEEVQEPHDPQKLTFNIWEHAQRVFLLLRITVPSLQSWVRQQRLCIKDESNLDRTEASSRDEGRHGLTRLSIMERPK